eukprot:3849629-Prymnesium_polylepis.1
MKPGQKAWTKRYGGPPARSRSAEGSTACSSRLVTVVRRRSFSPSTASGAQASEPSVTPRADGGVGAARRRPF